MQHIPGAAAIGVEFGEAAATLAIRGDHPPRVRRIDGTEPVEAVLGHVREVREATGPVPVAFAVPVSWERVERARVAQAAARAGLGAVPVAAAPEAAALTLESEPDTVALCDLGADACRVAVVRRLDGEYRVVASGATGEVGGGEFDQLLLAYLSGRYRDTDPAFWDRIDEPTDLDETVLRQSLLDEIRSARELLSKRTRAGVPLPGGDRDLHLTRVELESCLSGSIDQAAALVNSVIDEAALEPQALLLTGGASRTPVLAERLREGTGREPVLGERPESAAAEGAALLAIARAEPAGEAAGPRRSATRRLGVIAAVAVPLVAATAVFGSDLGSGGDPGAVSDPAPTAAPSQAAPTTPGSEPGSGGDAGLTPPEPGTIAPETTTPEPEPESSAPPTEDGGHGGGEAPEESTTAPDPAVVPPVTQLPAKEAEAVLDDAGFTRVSFHGEEEGVFGPWYDECEVIEQDPVGGDERELDAPITITFSFSGSGEEECLA